MKKIHLIFVLNVIFSPVFSQKNTTFGLNYSFGPAFQKGLKTIPDGTKFIGPKRGGSIAMQVQLAKEIHENLQFLAGIEAATVIISGKCDCTHWPSEIDPTNPGFYTRDPALDDKIKNRNDFIEAVLGVRKSYGHKTWRPFLEFGAGAGANVFFGKNAKTWDFVTQKPTGVSSFQTDIRPAFGISKATSAGTLSISCVGKYYLTQLGFKDWDAKYRYFTPGLEIGWLF